MIKISLKKYLFLLIVIVVFSAVSCSNQYDYENMVKRYSDCIKKSPNDSWAHNGRGFLYLYNNKFNEAVADFIKANQLLEYSGNYYGLAAAYLAKNNVNKAMANVNVSIKLDSKDLTSRGLRGICHDLMNNKTEAINDYTVYLNRPYSGHFAGKYYILHIRRSILFLYKGKYNKALKDLNSAMNYKFYKENIDDIYYLRFMINLKLGKKTECLKDFKEALDEGFNDKDTIENFIKNANITFINDIRKILTDYLEENEPFNGFNFEARKFVIDKFLGLKR